MPDLLERLQAALADRYAIEHEVGRGGMATVFLAEDLKHRRKVAIKVLHPELSVTLAAERFLNEIQIAAGLNHPHILMLIDSGEADGLLYYVMPYVSGESLRLRLEREGQLPVEESVRIAVEVADGLQHAHEQGVIHRDVKPGNILLSGKHAVITDFGIARAITVAQGERVTSTGLGVGTPLYASPEQVMGAETLDGRTDIYSLGCVLYEMLSGQVPLAASTPQAVQARRMSETPGSIHELRDTVPPLLDQVIAKALMRLPADRWESAEAFAQTLLTATMDATPVARLGMVTTPSLEAAASGLRRRRKSWLTVSAILALAAIATWYALQQTVLERTDSDQDGDAATRGAPVETKLELQGRLRKGSVPTFAISPDGQQLAYCTQDESGAARLWLADLTNMDRDHRLLSSGDRLCSWVRWTPSGDRILFDSVINGDFNFYAVSEHGGPVTPFNDCQGMSDRFLFEPRMTLLSPDATRMAYSSQFARQIRVLPLGECDLASANSISVAGESAFLVLHTWSLLGDRILFYSQPERGAGTLWTIGVDGRDQRAAAHGAAAWPANWVRDDQLLYYSRSVSSWATGHQMMRVGMASSGETVGAPEPVAYFEDNPIDWFSISADGKRAVVERRTNLYSLVRVRLNPEASTASTTIETLMDRISGLGAFEVSRDGRWIAFSQEVPEGHDLFRMPIQGGTPERMSRSGYAYGGKWSPDGRFVAYTAPQADTLRIWLVSSDGSSQGYVSDVAVSTTDQAAPGERDLSWEGRTLFYIGADGQLGALDSLEFEYGSMVFGQWAPAADSDTLHRTGSFVVRAQSERLTEGADWFWVYRPHGSPDGSRVVAAGLKEGELPSYWWLFTRRDSSFIPLVRALGSHVDPLGWTLDGLSLFWREGDDIYKMPVDGGTKEMLLTLPPGLEDCEPRKGIEQIEFICRFDHSYSELFVVENFDPHVN